MSLLRRNICNCWCCNKNSYKIPCCIILILNSTQLNICLFMLPERKSKGDKKMTIKSTSPCHLKRKRKKKLKNNNTHSCSIYFKMFTTKQSQSNLQNLKKFEPPMYRPPPWAFTLVLFISATFLKHISGTPSLPSGTQPFWVLFFHMFPALLLCL